MEPQLRNRIFIFVTVLFIVLLVSCSQTNTNTSLATNNETPPSITPSQTPSPVASSTQFITATPTYDSADATTYSEQATNQSSYLATEIGANATLAARNAVCDDGYNYPFNFQSQHSFFTTNSGGSWAVIECIPDNNLLKGYTRVVNRDGSKSWKIPYSFSLPDNSDDLVGSVIDPNGKYLYLVPDCSDCAMFPWPDSHWSFFGWGISLYRLDLSSGSFTTILPFDKNDYYNDISISPNAQYLAYSYVENGNTTLIQDLTKEDKKTIQLQNNYVATGRFIWSPNGEYLIFPAAIDGWKSGKAGLSLFRLDLNTMQLYPLVLNDSRDLIPWLVTGTSQPAWIDSNTLSLLSTYPDVQAGEPIVPQWSININTGQVNPLPTPTLTP